MAAGRAGPVGRAALQLARRRARRRLDVAVAAVAVAVAGLVAGLMATQARPYSMYDSVTPGKIPSGYLVATYVTGHYAVSAAQVAGRQVIWIDTNGTAPARASVLDVEPGNVPPATAATWARARLAAHPHDVARIYTLKSEWPAVKAAIDTLPKDMQSHVRWWIADPTGKPHVLPGSNATQWYWGRNFDISTVNPGF